MKLMAGLIVLCAILTVFFLFVRLNKKPLFGMFSKIVPSIGFVAMGAIGIMRGMDTLPKGASLILLGLAAGVVGDILIDMKRVQPEFEAEYLYGGMASFAFGHFAYITSAILIAKSLALSKIWLAVVVSVGISILAAPIIMFIATKFMNAKFGKFYTVSLLYAALLTFVTVFTIWLAILNPVFITLCIGMVLFLLSDLVLTTQFFVEGKKEDKLLVVINHVLYYGAQIMIAAFIFVLS